MAKLKIIDNDDGIARRRPNVQGYVNLVENLVLDPARYSEFLDAEEDERASLLQRAAGTDAQGRPCVIEQETSAGESEPIDEGNCRVLLTRDRKRVARRSRVVMKLPDAPLYDVEYLDVYIEELCRLHQDGEHERACKFLFGMMLLTRCR